MSKASEGANAVVYAAEQVCALYGVQYTREQSRSFQVAGAAGRWRPMFVGQWKDEHGKLHSSGKADLLARPRIRSGAVHLDGPPIKISVPLWIECKSGEGKMRPAQYAFKAWVEKNGDSYLLIDNDVRTLIQWFDAHGVERGCSEVEYKNVVEPMDASALNELPCRWCKQPRALHIGPGLGCAGATRKVWSPDLKAARP